MPQTLAIDGLKTRHWPINLRQSGNSDARILISTRIRKSPWWHLSKAAGCWAYTTYNHIYHPRAYIKPEDGGLLAEYEFLTQHVSMWDVAVERQIRVKGPDAAEFVNLLITRDVHKLLPNMQARYVILCNQYGGIINDPVLLRVADDEFWFSISDSDVLLWAQGVNSFAKFNVEIHEIDVSPLQIQGPKSVLLMEKMFGSYVREIPYYGLVHDTLNGHKVTISRTGFSAEIGFEIYLHDATLHADDVWPYILEQGKEFNLGVIAPSHIRRLEAGILSYGQDMDIENNPFEVRLGWQVDLTKESDFIGKDALTKIKQDGVKQRLVGLKLGGKPITWYNEDFYLVKDSGSRDDVGYVTSAFWSPNVGSNIALAVMPKTHWKRGTNVNVQLPNDGIVDASVVRVPFFDPTKEVPKTAL
ncbi:MAG: aminomethyl transferase family protein [Chloroflexi bacterium]|nr:aminomethyl transferase family protein [Chloroflexota bacterium]MYK61131.1 aminomethyl transferase family protein [Chloroflexota bacterium]